jgi:RNA polymerase sigma factor (sigma-70 family)
LHGCSHHFEYPSRTLLTITKQMLNQSNPDTTPELVAHLFRHEAGKMTATLTKHFGFGNVQIAEDIVQETMVSALQHWQRGVPPNPTAWLYRVAKNKALDVVRRKKHFSLMQGEIIYHTEQNIEDEQTRTLEQAFEKNSIEDSTLQMLFACCHPALSEEMQVALALKTLCGLSVQEIANAFLTGKDTIEKRLYRAKERIRASNIAIEFPPDNELAGRTDAVLRMIYLLFNEGYNSSHPDALIRHDICDEAERLCRLLTENPLTNLPQVNALLALMLFQSSRFDARLKESGELVILFEQNPSSWDTAKIAEGARFLAASSVGDVLSRYHLEAGIAAHYALAPSFEAIDWREIEKLYTVLLALAPSPIAQLNLVIVRSHLYGAETALGELSALETVLEKWYLLHATRGELLKRSGEKTLAKEAFQKARRLTHSAAEQAHLEHRIRDLL